MLCCGKNEIKKRIKYFFLKSSTFFLPLYNLIKKKKQQHHISFCLLCFSKERLPWHCVNLTFGVVLKLSNSFLSDFRPLPPLHPNESNTSPPPRKFCHKNINPHPPWRFSRLLSKASLKHKKMQNKKKNWILIFGHLLQVFWTN